MLYFPSPLVSVDLVLLCKDEWTQVWLVTNGGKFSHQGKTQENLTIYMVWRYTMQSNSTIKNLQEKSGFSSVKLPSTRKLLLHISNICLSHFCLWLKICTIRQGSGWDVFKEIYWIYILQYKPHPGSTLNHALQLSGNVSRTWWLGQKDWKTFWLRIHYAPPGLVKMVSWMEGESFPVASGHHHKLGLW